VSGRGGLDGRLYGKEWWGLVRKEAYHFDGTLCVKERCEFRSDDNQRPSQWFASRIKGFFVFSVVEVDYKIWSGRSSYLGVGEEGEEG
jgi:hypothetical protein